MKQSNIGEFGVCVTFLCALAILATSEAAAQNPNKASPLEAATVVVDKQVQGKLGKIVIMLTGADGVQTRLVEETLTLQFVKQGVGVVSRLRVERLLAEEMVKNRVASEKDARQAIHATSIAKSAGATAILVGTVNNESRMEPGKSGDRNANARLVKTISLQLVSVDTEEILWTTCQEFDESVGYNAIAQTLVSELRR